MCEKGRRKSRWRRKSRTETGAKGVEDDGQTGGGPEAEGGDWPNPGTGARPRSKSPGGPDRQDSTPNSSDGDDNGDGDEEPEVTFGVFAIRDLRAEEEIVLGWEWDDRHVVHELPKLLKDGYGSGT